MLHRHRDPTVPDPGVDRSGLVMGVDKPDATNTGVLTGVTRATINGNVSLGAGGLLKDKNVHGRVITSGSGWRIENCLIDGGTSNPGPLIECYVSGGGLVVDSEICSTPTNMHWNWNGPTGHSFTLLRCNIHHTTDGVGIFKTAPAGGGPGTTYNCNVIVQQCWIHDLAWWTANTGGIVHSDTETHNDGIQLQGGTNLQVLGNTIDAYHAHQFSHWWTVGQDPSEPYNFIAAQSLPSSAPYYGGPYQGARSYLYANRGTGDNASGRYNVGNISALMLNRNQGNVHSVNVTDNWFNGGNACVNGGLTRLSGEELGVFYRNKFDHGQGNAGLSITPGSDNTLTFLINSSYVGHVDGGVGTSNKNIYADNSVEVNFRITG